MNTMAIDPLALAYLGATLPLVGGVIGSSMGLGYSCSAGASVLAEDPAQFRNVLILASLPITQTFYGLIQLIYMMSIYIPSTIITPYKGLGLVGVGMIGFAAEWFSAWYQGRICAAGIAELPRTKGRNLMNAIIMAVYVELWGILGIVFTVLTLSLIG